MKYSTHSCALSIYFKRNRSKTQKHTRAKNKTWKLTDIFRKIEQRQYITMTLVKSSTISNERKSRWQEIGVCYTMEIDFRAHISLSFSHMTQKNETPSTEGKKSLVYFIKKMSVIIKNRIVTECQKKWQNIKWKITYTSSLLFHYLCALKKQSVLK